MADLSVIIPARNEVFLRRTIEDVLKNIRGDTEIIAVLDGYWPDPVIHDHPRVTLIHHTEPVGQRAATNEAARLSRAKYLMKCDAHCSFDVGFDVKLMADCDVDWTVVPRMYNLHAFDWVCEGCGARLYQGPTPKACGLCGGGMTKEILWKAKRNPETDFCRFDRDLHFQYWREYKKRPEAQGDIADNMSILGACFFMRSDWYWEIEGLDESHGSWGQMGTEVACKTWLAGGRLVTNKKTWFAHLFRTQGGDFGFPYFQSQEQVEIARKRSRELWLENTWERAVYPLQWLIDKFAPVPDWSDQ